MKKLLVIILFALTLTLLISCGECAHEWSEATCTEPKTCSKCGATEGEPTNHALGEWVIDAPSCTEDGSKTRSCACGKESETEKINKLGHDITKHHGKAPTCTDKGYADYEDCSRCSYTTYEELPPSHSYKSTVTAPTCTTEGFTTHVCEACGNSYTDAKTEKLQHSFGEWQETPASCEADGVKTRSCSCGAVESETITKLGHDLSDVSAKEASCKAVGYSAHKACSRCDYKEGYVEVEKTSHEYIYSTVPSGCTTRGYTTYTCTGCGFSYQDNFTEPEHKFGDWQITPATCEDTGLKVRSCPCGTLHEEEELPATGHSFGDWVTVLEPECETKGLEKRSCHCGETEENELPETGHSYGDWVNVNEPDCDSEGLKKRTCPCGDVDEEIIPPTHKLIHHPGKDASCTETGYKPYDTCELCDYTTYEVIPMHKYVDTVTAPTCTERGYTTHVCSECHDTYVDNYVDAVGHSWGAWYISKPISLTEDAGENRRDCLSCDGHETKAFEIVDSGNFGAGSTAASNIIYKIYEDGTLKISGTGATFSCGWNGANQPFFKKNESIRFFITRIVIGEGVETISSGEFSNLPNVTEVIFPTTLKNINTNAFMDSFKSGVVTELTIPASVINIGEYAIGFWREKGAMLTDVIFENPSINFKNNSKHVINGGANTTDLRLYSYGAENNVSRYAAAIGATYIDLNNMAKGTVDNISYTLFNGKLSLSLANTSGATVLPATQPWLTNVDKSSVKTVTIGHGITEIPAEFFLGYTALESVSIAESVTKIGNMAFACDSANDTALSLNFPKDIASIGVNVFKNRTKVTVDAFSGSAADSFEEGGVTVKLFRTYQLLLIGNSLSQDAADNSGAGTASQLYNIIKAMLGESSFVEIGTLYSGAKTAAWHATMASQDAPKYAFTVISDATGGKWKSLGTSTLKYGLEYTSWDHITIQPYATEANTGTASLIDTAGPECDERFLPLAVSLPYLLDYINTYSGESKVYYYLTWSTNKIIKKEDFLATPNAGLTINHGASAYETMLGVAKTASAYKGTNSGKGFDGLIPAGTAVQYAKTTYLALLNYQYGWDENLNEYPKTDPQWGIQRDHPHLSYGIGRYIVALLFAEVLISEDMRADSYTLPSIKDSALVGEMPEEYTTIARLAVSLTLESMKKTGADQYRAGTITGYETDPADELKAALLAYDLKNLTAGSKAALEAKIAEIAKGLATEGTEITVTANDVTPGATAQTFTATVTVRFGYTTRTFTVTGTVKN